MKILVIFNPKARKWKIKKFEQEVRPYLTCYDNDAEIWPWEYPEQIDDLIAKALQKAFNIVFAAGGDGTVHQIGVRLIGSPLVLGILPIGSGNGIANHFNIPRSPKKAIEILSNYEIITIDTGLVNGLPFIGFFSLGLDACVVHALKGRKRGFWQYFTTALNIFYRYQAEQTQLYWEGKSETWKTLLVGVVNTAQYGNKVRVAPHASALDGKLELIGLLPIRFWQLPALMYYSFSGSIARFRAYRYYTLNAPLTIHRSGVLFLQQEKGQMDGEPILLPSEIKVEVAPASLKLLVPKQKNLTF
jgi:diacylglycerol kinase family enzyme